MRAFCIILFITIVSALVAVYDDFYWQGYNDFLQEQRFKIQMLNSGTRSARAWAKGGVYDPEGFINKEEIIWRDNTLKP